MQREYPSHVLYVLSEVLFSCVCIKCVLTLVFTHSSSRDRMYPKLFVIYPWLRIVSSIFVSSFLLLCGQNVMLQLLRLEGILNRKHTGFWADLNDIQSSHPLWSATFLTLWWRDENAVFEARCEGISWAVSRRGSLHFWRADFVSDWKVQFVKDESAVIKSNIYAVREKEFYTLSANGIFFTSLWENKNSIHHLPRPYTVIWACLYNTLCYVKASLSWPGCGWLVSWINNASSPPPLKQVTRWPTVHLCFEVKCVQCVVSAAECKMTFWKIWWDKWEPQIWLSVIMNIQYFCSTINTVTWFCEQILSIRSPLISQWPVPAEYSSGQPLSFVLYSVSLHSFPGLGLQITT